MALLDRMHAVILDLDGTLIDSMQIWHQIDIDFFAENGLELPEGLSETVAKMSIDQWAAYFVRNFVPHFTPAQVTARIEEMAAEHYREKIPMKPHVTAFLDTLDARGCPTASAPRPTGALHPPSCIGWDWTRGCGSF